jgi:hypothetical protein
MQVNDVRKGRKNAVRPDDARDNASTSPASTSPRSPRREFDPVWLQAPATLTTQQISDCIAWLNDNIKLIPARERRRARQLRHALLTERNARRKAKTAERLAKWEARKEVERREWISAALHEALLRELHEFHALAIALNPGVAP